MFAAGKKFAELTGRKKRPQRQLTQPMFWPAAQGGINAVSSATMVPIQDSLLMINMIPAEAGTKVRKGYVEWSVKVPLGDGIKTLVPFSQAKIDAPTDRLFATTSDGIYDVTVAGAAPVKKFDFAVKSNEAGWCSWCHYTTTAGQFICLCDKVNGYIIYTASTNTWALGAINSGGGDPPINAASVFFVMAWKNRLWFIEKDTGRAWYTSSVGAITGTVKPFEFGNKFKFGGYCKSLWTWTLDGGEGVDDYLVALSSAGDMLIYKGTDPNTSGEFILHGTWYLGRLLQGSRQGGDMGGELMLLSNYGVLQMSKLISGMPATDAGVSISYKVNPRINSVAQRMADFYGWEMVFNPKDQFAMVITPKETGQPWLQFVYSNTTRAWCLFTGLPIKTATMWKDKMYFGTDDNRICTYDGYLDKVLLNPAEGTFESVQWESLTGFQALDAPAKYKRVNFLRPMFIGSSTPIYKIVARYDFNLSPPAGSPIFPATTGGIWGVGVWDFSTWGGGYIVGQDTKGGNGLGRYVAIYMRGRSASELTHVGTDVLYDTGGML